MQAVKYLHRKNIIHGDLKPENVFLKDGLDNGVDVKVTNFRSCLSGVKLGEVVTGLDIGHPYYKAPEVLSGQFDHQVDLWSCGVIMYFLLSGTVPFNAWTDEEVLEQLRGGRVRYDHANWRVVPKQAKDLVRKLLDIRPQTRISAERCFQHIFIRNTVKHDLADMECRTNREFVRTIENLPIRVVKN